MSSRQPDIDHVAAAMTLAAEKFGQLRISGSKDFKQQVLDVAVVKDLNVVFADKKMQALFLEQKAAHKQEVNTDKQTLEDVVKATQSKNEISEDKDVAQHDKVKDNDVVKDSDNKEPQADKPDQVETFVTDYRLDKETKKLVVTINGESPDKVSEELLKKIVGKDRFLRCYSVEQVQNGSLDMKQANGVQAVPKEYDANANIVEQVDTEAQSQGLKLR